MILKNIFNRFKSKKLPIYTPVYPYPINLGGYLNANTNLLPVKMKMVVPNNFRTLNIEQESILLPILNMSDKFLLTGSSVLHMLDIIKREPNDVDLGLRSPLTQEELEHLINFFGLIIHHNNQSESNGYGRSKKISNVKDLLKEDIMSFLVKNPKYSNAIDSRQYLFKIDIFNKEYIKDKDIVLVNYTTSTKDHISVIKCIHPSIPISYKARYAFDPRISANLKHSDDLKDILLDRKHYFQVVTKNLSNKEEEQEMGF